jgi:hypothetical protein
LQALVVTEGLEATGSLTVPFGPGGGGSSVYVPVVPEVC